jgi:hypothetical protein
MSKFKIGDLVNVYGYWYEGGSCAKRGRITESAEDRVRVKGEFVDLSAHPKQCRKIITKKKRPQVTREQLAKWWDTVMGSNYGAVIAKESGVFARLCQFLGVEQMEQANDCFLISAMREKAEKTLTHQGVLALVGPNNESLYVPFEITTECFEQNKTKSAQSVFRLVMSATDTFLEHINDGYFR